MSKFKTFALCAASLILAGQGCALGSASPTNAPASSVPEEDRRSAAIEGTMMEEGTKVMMRGGVMMMERNGQTSKMTGTMMTADESKAMTNGQIMMKDGTSMMLKDGEGMMSKGGAMVKMMGTAEETPASVTVTKSFTVTAKQWSFTPSEIKVKKDDRVKLAIKSIDVSHGFALSAFNVNQNLEPGQEVTVEFVADKTGSFPFVCSVFCGSGHGGMKGTLIVE